LNHVQHDANRFRELIEEGLVDRAEGQKTGELNYGFDISLEEDGQNDNIARRSLA
jgi:hypothetical protein